MTKGSSISVFSQQNMYMNLAVDIGRSRASRAGSDESSQEEVGFTVYEASLSIISSVIGGGIISIPYAMTTNGL